MGTNYYFMSRNKELMQTCFADKSEWGVLGEEYTIVDEPYLGYRCHLNKLSCGWRPLFQKHIERLIVFGSWRRFTGSIRKIWKFMMNMGGSIRGKSILRRFMHIADIIRNR